MALHDFSRGTKVGTLIPALVAGPAYPQISEVAVLD